uniref:Uncharacterized protein n=1 Tax=Utricularia reniformis TaxID=192314 RepID=A0A1Y0B4F8_9LAMI|nr:hypothetical protein AEK19_MT2121 [Utricularia reniformis]ART32273.1 hypothetical protein AEK19_MT2121 [Utricularia reniformis]
MYIFRAQNHRPFVLELEQSVDSRDWGSGYPLDSTTRASIVEILVFFAFGLWSACFAPLLPNPFPAQFNYLTIEYLSQGCSRVQVKNVRKTLMLNSKLLGSSG